MTNDNYTNIITIIQQIVSNNKRNWRNLIEKNDTYTKFIYENTMFLPKDSEISERIYCLLYDIHEIQMCPTCKINPLKFIKFSKGYSHHCCPRCSSLDEKVQQKSKETCNKTYGVEYSFQAESVKDKIKKSLLEHLGVENPSYSNQVLDKIKKTTLEHLGVEYSFQSEIVKQKIRETNLKNHNVEYYNQSNESKVKHKNTCRKRWGVDAPAQSNEIMNKIRTTNNIRYGGDAPACSKDVIAKMKSTCNKKFGVDSYAKTNEFAKQIHKKYTNPKYPGMTFGSSWEFIVYDFLIENHIEFEYQPEISFQYEYDGRTWTYHPDFLINGKIYEVKGDMFFQS